MSLLPHVRADLFITFPDVPDVRKAIKGRGLVPRLGPHLSCAACRSESAGSGQWRGLLGVVTIASSLEG